MAEKCAICNEKIEKLFLEKVNGTIVKIKKDGKNEKIYICSNCQKKFGRNLKKEVENKSS
ncbi:MAG: hypothetical protein ACOYT4_00875 [Nanoarchaeota archaeon]